MRPFVKRHLDPILKQCDLRDIHYIPFWGGVPDIKGVLDDSCLSNWFYRDMVYQGQTFLTAEHAMMWSKAKFFNDHDAMQRILKVKTPREAKMIGREVRNFNQHRWTEESYQIVADVVRAKFLSAGNEDLKAYLLNFPDNTIFIEASPYDKIWGVGMDRNHANIFNPDQWLGDNKLGFILTELHRTLTEKA